MQITSSLCNIVTTMSLLKHLVELKDEKIMETRKAGKNFIVEKTARCEKS